MARFSFAVDSSLPATAVLAAATDFSERRPRLWPNIDPGVYRVHSLAPGRAEVTEGSTPLGGVWARESYDWLRPGTVRATVQESNIFHPGGTWELRARGEPDGGCRVEVSVDRQARGIRGWIVGVMMTLAGPKIHRRLLERTLAIVAGEESDPAFST